MSYPCPECHRQFGDDERCEHCDFAPPVSSREQSRAAVEAARRLLAEQRKGGKIGGAGATRERPPAWPTPSEQEPTMADDTPRENADRDA